MQERCNQRHGFVCCHIGSVVVLLGDGCPVVKGNGDGTCESVLEGAAGMTDGGFTDEGKRNSNDNMNSQL